MKAAPRAGTPSYSLGLGPAVGFTDRARVLAVGDRTCIPSRCFSRVLLVDEFNPDQPGKHQLKYYAPGVGNVRVGWSGAKEDSKETLVLVALERLGARGVAKARSEALKLEASAYRTSRSVYGHTHARRGRADRRPGASDGPGSLLAPVRAAPARRALRPRAPRIVLTARVTSLPDALRGMKIEVIRPGGQDRPHRLALGRQAGRDRERRRCHARSTCSTRARGKRASSFSAPCARRSRSPSAAP